MFEKRKMDPGIKIKTEDGIFTIVEIEQERFAEETKIEIKEETISETFE